MYFQTTSCPFARTEQFMAMSRDEQATRTVASMLARTEEWPFRSNAATSEFLQSHARLVKVGFVKI